MNDREANLLAHQHLSNTTILYMLGSVLGAVFGALFGGGVTYFVQRRLEAKRRHEETLKELRDKAGQLIIEVQRLMESELEGGEVDPSEAQRIAEEMTYLATELDDEEFKRTIFRALYGKYENGMALVEGLRDLEQQLNRWAYPVLHEVRKEEEKNSDLVSFLLDRDTELEWTGPANSAFMYKMSQANLLDQEVEDGREE